MAKEGPFSEAHLAALRAAQTDELREKRRQRAKALWADPVWRANTLAKKRETCQSLEFREKVRRIASEQWQDPETRDTRPAQIRDGWARRKARMSSPEAAD